MNTIVKTGRLFFGLGMMAYGIQQLVIRDFRPEIVPPFPEWAHTFVVIPIITGLATILAGLLISGAFTISAIDKRKLCLYLGFYFLALIIVCHLPYLIFIFPHRLYHLGVWSEALKELAFSGGAFVMAASFPKAPADKTNSFNKMLEALVQAGPLFFCTTMILFGCSHFVYLEFISKMVPAWFGMPTFWAGFGGAALIAAGVAIVFRIYLKTVALLLATMLLLWFFLLHVPGAMANPTQDRGNLIVSAFDALLFCGTALVISQSKKKTLQESSKNYVEELNQQPIAYSR